MARTTRWSLYLRVSVGIVTSLPAAWASAADQLSYNRDIRPILSDKCFSCHGPDSHGRKADLRLDVIEDGDGYTGAYLTAIVPGDTDSSDLVSRIHDEDATVVMPPPESGLSLTDDEKRLLRRWIEQGAKYQKHWAFEPVRRPAVPEVAAKSWPTNAIDRFALARLEAERLTPSPEAAKHTLLRRLSLDLTGLPPTEEELDAFLNDPGADAYEKQVDRLLASRHFGERMAVPWLDAARYADTNGFSIDDHRDMWLWREWVIDAFNRNMPFDRFVVEQVAGDLLPDATDHTRLATGFLRNSMNTHEGGTIPEEYRVIAIADKIDTVSTVFLGLTARCAQCHDHKYDPISQREYYELFAFFDTAHEPGKGATNANTPPIIRMDGLLTDNQKWKADIEARIATLERCKVHPPELVEPRAAWEAEALKTAEGPLREALEVSPQHRTEEQWKTINDVFAKTTELFGRHVTTLNAEIAVLEKEIKAGRPSVMVMKERGPAKTYVLSRGQYDQPDTTQHVTPGVPKVLPPLDTAGPDTAPTRLDLARWLVRPDHPLTSRVAVNRTWQMFFGRGLVATPNDFGSQGSFPTHSELLDFLAADFVESGWDTKRLIKQIVMSATYRQSSRASPELIERDPYNELLARASRIRLPAEFIRDGALAVSGRLNSRIGGPSVYPVQPDVLWREISHFGYPQAFTAQAFYPSDASGLTRRSLYTFWKRTSPPPSLVTFDAPSREVCTVDRTRTNTPLQALVLLNDPEYVDSAKALAALAMKEGGPTSSVILDAIFRRATGRLPDADERGMLERLREKALRRFEQAPDAAGAASIDGTPNQAAWTLVASSILNLDETITRE